MKYIVGILLFLACPALAQDTEKTQKSVTPQEIQKTLRELQEISNTPEETFPEKQMMICTMISDGKTYKSCRKPPYIRCPGLIPPNQNQLN